MCKRLEQVPQEAAAQSPALPPGQSVGARPTAATHGAIADAPGDVRIRTTVSSHSTPAGWPESDPVSRRVGRARTGPLHVACGNLNSTATLGNSLADFYKGNCPPASGPSSAPARYHLPRQTEARSQTDLHSYGCGHQRTETAQGPMST